MYWPAALRGAFDALLGIDDAMADVVVRATQPALAAIKLAWWRGQLEALDAAEPPAEPRLQLARRELIPRGISGRDLATLEQGWAALLADPPDPGMHEDRGACLFRLGARLLDVEPDSTIERAGRVFALADAARRGLIDAELGRTPAIGPISRKARPMTGLAALAARDLRRGGPPFEPEATPGRALALLRHRLTGRIS